jgi:hypothetical protein
LRRQREHLAGQPLQRAVLAEVDDRVGAPGRLQPAVDGEVVVRRGQLGVVVDADRIVAVAARRLDRDQHVAQRQRRHHIVVAVDELLARRRAPALLHRRAQRLRQRRVPALVLGDRQAQRRGGELLVGDELRVVPAARDQRVHELVAVGVGPVDVIAGLVQRVEQPERARRRVEADRHPDARVLRRKARQQHRDLLLRVRRRAQPRMAHGQARDAGAALAVGDVARDRGADDRAALAALLEGHDAAEQAPVELGDRDLGGGVQRRQPADRLQPRRPRRGRADGLDDRHVEGLQGGRVPVLLGVAGVRAAGREHRDQQRVDVTVEQRERRDVAVAVAPQGRAPHGERVGAGRLDLRGELVDPDGVAGDPVRAVEADADRRTRAVEPRERVLDRHVAGPGDVYAEIGHLVRRLEAMTLEQERVGEEAQQLLDVVDVAVAQVLARLGDRAGRRQRQRGHLRVGLDLAAEREQRDAVLLAARAQQVEALGPAAAAAEDPAQDHGGAVEQLVDEGRLVDRTARIRAAHGGEVAAEPLDGGGRGKDLGVSCRDEAQQRRAPPRGSWAGRRARRIPAAR